MAPEPSGMDQVVSRALRDNLDKLQRMAEELQQAVADLVAACASSRPSNVLPPMVRAQAAAASLAAALDVLSRFTTLATRSAQPAPGEAEAVGLVGLPAAEPAAKPVRPPPSIPVPMGEKPRPASVEAPRAADRVTPAEARAPEAAALVPGDGDAAPAEAFDIKKLSKEEQEMHRRANRVAKVSMQDIKMLRPDLVKQGRLQKDICARLGDDIEKARKEYDRRFRPIMDHPVDYFYSWMVEILGGGDPEALGAYPYPSPVLRK